MSLARKKFLRARRALHNPCSRSNKQSLQHSIGESYQTVTWYSECFYPSQVAERCATCHSPPLDLWQRVHKQSENNPPQAEWRIRPPILDPDSFDTLSCKRQGVFIGYFLLSNDVTKTPMM